MDGEAARVAASESGDERVQSLNISVLDSLVSTETSRDVSTLLDMTRRTVAALYERRTNYAAVIDRRYKEVEAVHRTAMAIEVNRRYLISLGQRDPPI
jgi:hypothetical protein